MIPEVTWAQRSNANDETKNILYLTINVPDISPSSLKLDLTPEKLYFSGTNTKGVNYAIDLNFYAEIDVQNSKTHHTARGIDFILRKKEKKAEFWPRLLTDAKKFHFLKTDFDKWVDEDEQDGTDGPALGDDMMGGGGGMGGLDFSQLAAAQGLNPDAFSTIPQSGGGGSDDEDEDMPELEGESPQEEEEDKSEEQK